MPGGGDGPRGGGPGRPPPAAATAAARCRPWPPRGLLQEGRRRQHRQVRDLVTGAHGDLISSKAHLFFAGNAPKPGGRSAAAAAGGAPCPLPRSARPAPASARSPCLSGATVAGATDSWSLKRVGSSPMASGRRGRGVEQMYGFCSSQLFVDWFSRGAAPSSMRAPLGRVGTAAPHPLCLCRSLLLRPATAIPAAASRWQPADSRLSARHHAARQAAARQQQGVPTFEAAAGGGGGGAGAPAGSGGAPGAPGGLPSGHAGRTQRAAGSGTEPDQGHGRRRGAGGRHWRRRWRQAQVRLTLACSALQQQRALNVLAAQ